MKEKCQKNQRILVIDDSESVHEDFRTILGSTDADTAALNEAKAAIFGDTSNSSEQISFELDWSPDDVMAADAVILPGVGAGEDTMNALKNLGMISAIKQYVDECRPFLGICIGMQVLFTGTEEGGWHECLDIVGGRVVKLPGGQKIPHMG